MHSAGGSDKSVSCGGCVIAKSRATMPAGSRQTGDNDNLHKTYLWRKGKILHKNLQKGLQFGTLVLYYLRIMSYYAKIRNFWQPEAA